MNPKIKKYFIIILFLTFLASIVYIWFNSRSASVTPKISPIKPSLNQSYKGKFPITLSLTENEFNFPKELPFMEFESSAVPLTIDFAKKVALSLDFPGEPTTINDPIDGTTYFWKNDEGIIFVYSKSRKIKFSSNKLNVGLNKQLSDVAITSISREFILKGNLLEENAFQIGPIKFLEQIPNGEGFRETTKEKAILYQISILPKITEYDFVSLSSVEPASYVQMIQDGSVYSFQITIFPTLKNSITQYKLIDYDQIKASLDEAVLIEIRGDTYLLSDLPSDSIQSVEIDKIEIAYLIESFRSTSFQPVYKLTGKATLKNPKYVYVATFYLAAVAQN